MYDPNYEAMKVGKFTVGEMRAAFDKVCDKRDWKNPIRAVIADEAIEVTVAAIEFFTASKAKVTAMLGFGEGMSYLIAEGYYAGPAGA